MGVDAVQELSDLDILRQIRDANPDSQLPILWSEDKDPYTEWEGVTWNDEKIRVILLDVNSKQVLTLQNVNKLTALQTLDCSSNQLTALNVDGLTKDSFILKALSPERKFTKLSTSAHSLYEKSDPFYLPGPGGSLDLHETEFIERADGTVEVKGTKFIPTPKYQVKLEGVEKVGYRTITIGLIS